jgi:IS4 transposase
LKGIRRRDKQSRQNARREGEPWLLIASPAMALASTQIVSLYRRRMQIELSFRDLKSHRYGQAFEDSLTRKRERIEVLLLLHALALFVAWLAGIAAEAERCQHKLNPHCSERRLYSIVRLGWEALSRRWLSLSTAKLIEILRSLSPEALHNMAVQR